MDTALGLLLLGVMAATATLYWMLIVERDRRRRIERRLSATQHLAAVVRAHLAERRTA